MEIDKEDLRLTILGCFRYSLGRMTYMPSHTLRIIKNNKEIFKEHDWKSFIREIDECKHLGMDCDERTWLELKRFSIEQIKEKRNGNSESNNTIKKMPVL